MRTDQVWYEEEDVLFWLVGNRCLVSVKRDAIRLNTIKPGRTSLWRLFPTVCHDL